MSNDYKPKYAQIVIREVKTKNGVKKVLQFPKGATFSVNGVEMDLGDYGTVFIKNREELEQDLQFKIGKGWLTEEKAEKQVAYFDEKLVVAAADVKAKA